MGWLFPIRPCRDNRQYPAHERVFAEWVSIIALVGEQRFQLGHWQGHQFIDSGLIRGFATGQHEADRQSLIVAVGVELACKAAA